MLLEGCSKRERDADTCHRDKVVPTAVTNSRQRVHFGVHADDATARRRRRAVLELCAPGSRKAEVMPSDRETARRHEVGQEVMCVSVRKGKASAVGSTAPLSNGENEPLLEIKLRMA